MNVWLVGWVWVGWDEFVRCVQIIPSTLDRSWVVSVSQLGGVRRGHSQLVSWFVGLLVNGLVGWLDKFAQVCRLHHQV